MIRKITELCHRKALAPQRYSMVESLQGKIDHSATSYSSCITQPTIQTPSKTPDTVFVPQTHHYATGYAPFFSPLTFTLCQSTHAHVTSQNCTCDVAKCILALVSCILCRCQHAESKSVYKQPVHVNVTDVTS